jgi:cytoskeletal protein CcmA (bactofilin family)
MTKEGNGLGSAEKRTLIEEGTELKGKLSSKFPIVVMGHVEGDVSGPAVQVTETGVVAGRMKVTALKSRGEVAGEIDADEIRLSGRVRDKTVLRAKTLEVLLERAEGKTEVVFGDCEIEVGEAPDKAAAIRAATSRPQQMASSSLPADLPVAVSPEAPSPEAGPGTSSQETASPDQGASAVPERIEPEASGATGRRSRKPTAERTAESS